jgi:hypothetical protein
MPTSNLQVGLIQSVTKAVEMLYLEIVQRLSGPGYPDVIAANTKTEPTRQDGNSVRGAVVINASPGAAPMALAFEYGSGIHAEHGARSKYPIVPVNASMLAFNWPDAASIAQREDVNMVNFGPDGKVFLSRVLHPGIAAKPYIRPSIEARLPEIIEMLGDDVLITISRELGPDMVVIR